MSGCERYEEMISALSDGELSAKEEAELRAHMEQCPDCRAMYEAFAAVGEAIGAQEVPATLHSGIMDKVHTAEKASRTQHTIIRLRPILAAAACLVVLVGTVFALKNTVFPARSDAMKAVPAAAPQAAEKAAGFASGGTSGAAEAPAVPEEEIQSDAIFESKVEAAEAPAPDMGVNAALDAVEAPEAPKAVAARTAAFMIRMEARTDAGLTGIVTDTNGLSIVSENAQVTVLWDGDSSAWEIGTLLEVTVDAQARSGDEGGIRAVDVIPAEVAPVQ